MMELIVLGEIPGTHIVITFQSTLAIMSLLLGVAIARQITKQHNHSNDTSVEEITL
jgi:hypothetical protein